MVVVGGVGLIPHCPCSERLRWGRVRQRRICEAARTSTDGFVVLLRSKSLSLDDSILWREEGRRLRGKWGDHASMSLKGFYGNTLGSCSKEFNCLRGCVAHHKSRTLRSALVVQKQIPHFMGYGDFENVSGKKRGPSAGCSRVLSLRITKSAHSSKGAFG